MMMTDNAKLEWIHFAIQEAMNDNPGELEQALGLVEELREKTFDARTDKREKIKRLSKRRIDDGTT